MTLHGYAGKTLSVESFAPTGPVKQTYYRVNGANILLYEPVELAENSQILVVGMHGGQGRTLEHAFMKQLAMRGFRSAWVVPDSLSFPGHFPVLNACIKALRGLDGVKKTVLMGQSRGASEMSAYQKIAENGVGVYQGPDRLLPFPDMVLEPADGLMLLDANFGFMIMHMMSINPALVEADNAIKVDPKLDPLNPENGYAPDGKARYSAEFKHKFLMAQRDRYYMYLKKAQERWELLKKGEGNYSDDEPFIVPGGFGTNHTPKLFVSDLRLLSHTKGKWPLIHPDRSITTEVVPSVRVDQNKPAHGGTVAAAFQTTVKEFLWLELEIGEDYDYGEDYLAGVNFDSSFTCSSGNVKMISCPLLLMGHTGSFEFIASEWCYNNARSEDKTIAFAEGAGHSWTSIDVKKYGDTQATTADFVTNWLIDNSRFLD